MDGVRSHVNNQLSAQRADIGKLQTEISKFGQNYNELKTMVEDLRSPATDDFPTRFKDADVKAFSSSRVNTDNSAPHRVRIRGWASYGAPNNERIKKEEFEKHAKALKAMLPGSLQSFVRVEAPYATNHQILLRIIG